MWVQVAFRITSKFLPNLANMLANNPGARLRAHIDMDYLVPNDLAVGHEVEFLRGKTLSGSTDVKFNLILSDMLVGRQFLLGDWDGLNSYKKQASPSAGSAGCESRSFSRDR